MVVCYRLKPEARHVEVQFDGARRAVAVLRDVELHQPGLRRIVLVRPPQEDNLVRVLLDAAAFPQIVVARRAV